MSSLIYRWLLLRWGDVLYPEGGHGVEDVQGIANSSSTGAWTRPATGSWG